VSRLSRQCGILNISQPYRPPRPVTGTALLPRLQLESYAELHVAADPMPFVIFLFLISLGSCIELGFQKPFLPLYVSRCLIRSLGLSHCERILERPRLNSVQGTMHNFSGFPGRIYIPDARISAEHSSTAVVSRHCGAHPAH
jgi:hypothetical protein